MVVLFTYYCLRWLGMYSFYQLITGGSDYTPTVVLLQFDATNDDQRLCELFGIIDDLNSENDELFCVTLTSNEPAGSVIVDLSNATVTIIDDDGKKYCEYACHCISKLTIQ